MAFFTALAFVYRFLWLFFTGKEKWPNVWEYLQLGYWYYGVDPTSFPRWKMNRISYIGFFKLWGPRKFSYPTSNIIFQGRKLENLKAYGWKPRKYLGFQFPMFPQKPHSFPRWRDLGKVWGFKGFCQHFFITIGILADFCCHE